MGRFVHLSVEELKRFPAPAVGNIHHFFDSLAMAYPLEKTRIVLLIDDDADDRDIFCEALHEVDNSARCIAVQDGAEALHMLQAQDSTLPDFIFLDLNMPRLNGQQCLSEIKKTSSLLHIPVIIYTTSKRQQDIDETKSLGAAHFITKPNTFEGICKSIACVLATGPQMKAAAPVFH